MPAPLNIFVFFGLIASGKSTLALSWARRRGIACYNSDMVRKEIAGLAPECSQKESFNKGIYSKEFTEKTYRALLERAAEDLASGSSVILDASYQYKKFRQGVVELAKKTASKAHFILCSCPEEEMRRRMELRSHDPRAVSDGRWEIYLQQKDRFEKPDELGKGECLILDTSRPVAVLLDEIEELILQAG